MGMNFSSRDLNRLATRPAGIVALVSHDYGKARRLCDEWNDRDKKDEFNRLTRNAQIPLQIRQSPLRNKPWLKEHLPELMQDPRMEQNLKRALRLLEN